MKIPKTTSVSSENVNTCAGHWAIDGSCMANNMHHVNLGLPSAHGHPAHGRWAQLGKKNFPIIWTLTPPPCFLRLVLVSIVGVSPFLRWVARVGTGLWGGVLTGFLSESRTWVFKVRIVLVQNSTVKPCRNSRLSNHFWVSEFWLVEFLPTGLPDSACLTKIKI